MVSQVRMETSRLVLQMIEPKWEEHQGQYLLLQDQDTEWDPVIRNFVSECALEGYLEIIKDRPLLCRRWEYDEKNQIVKKESWGAPMTKVILSSEAIKFGYSSIRSVFKDWFNKQGIFEVKEWKADHD